MINAKKALDKTNQAIGKREQKELNKVIPYFEKEIKRRIEWGQSSISSNHFAHLPDKLVWEELLYFEKLGYKIKHGSSYTMNGFEISWEEQK